MRHRTIRILSVGLLVAILTTGSFVVFSKFRAKQNANLAESPAAELSGNQVGERPLRHQVLSTEVSRRVHPLEAVGPRQLKGSVAEGRPVDPFGAPYDDDPRPEGTAETAQRDLPVGAREALIAILEDEIREKGGVFGYNSRSYGATLDAGWVELATNYRFREIGSPRLSYALEQVDVGGKVIARGGTTPPILKPQERTVAYERGSVLESYVLRPEAMEQTFVIRDLPEGRGQITVTGRVETNLDAPAEGTRGTQLSFSYKQGEVARISEAVAVDAAGRRTDLELSYQDGRVSIIVPAAWVAAAELPILIDPLIGPAITVLNSTYGNGNTNYNVDYFGVRTTDVAYSELNNSWFVVWTEKFGASTWDYDVRAQRVTAAGALTGGIVGICTTSAGSYEPTISVGRTTNAQNQPVDRYLIAWRHDPTADGGVADQNIFGKIHGQDGVFFTLNPFQISNTSGQDLCPSTAYDGTRFFVTWTNRISSSRYDVRGQFVTATGTVPNINTTYNPAIVTNIAGGGAVAYANGVYVVAWEEGTGSSRAVRARTMLPDGSFPSPSVEVEPAANTPAEVDVSGGGAQALIAWRRTSNNDVKGRIANATTANPMTFAGASFALTTGATARQTPRAAYSTTDSAWLVVFRDGVTGSGDVYAAQVSSGGTVTSPVQVSSGTTDEWRPELAWNSTTNEFLVVWRKDPINSLVLMGQRFSLATIAPPATPTGLAATPGDAQVALTWTAVAGATSYKVKRGTSPGSHSTVIPGVGTNGYTDTGLTNGIPYYYVVSAVNLAGESADSTEVSATPIAPPDVPTNLVATPSDGAVSLSWTASAGAATYTVKRGTTSGTYPTTFPGLTSTNFLDTGLTNGIPYYYVVSATNASGTSGNSAEASATPAPVPAAPTNVLATAGETQITVQWTGSAGSTSYTVKRATSASGPFTVIASLVAGTSFIDLDVIAGTSYFYVVSALNGSGESVGSSQAMASPASGPPLPPTDLTAGGGTMPGTTVLGQVGLRWKGNGPSYNVQRATSPGGPYTHVTIRTPLESFTDRNLTLGRTYYYVVTTQGTNGESAPSEEVSVTPSYPFDRPLLAPQNVSTWSLNGKVRILWDPVPGAQTYRVWRSTNPENPLGDIVVGDWSQDELFITDANVTIGTKYYYVVQALNHLGVGIRSDPPEPATPKGGGPTAFKPTLRVLTSVQGIVVLAWTRGIYNNFYKVKVSSTQGGPYVDASGHYMDGMSPTDEGHLMWLDFASSTNYFVVSMVDNGGEGPNSNEVTVAPNDPGDVPFIPAGMAAVAGDGVVTLSWDRETAATSYQVYRSTGGGPAEFWGFTYATWFEDWSVTNGQTYTYSVKAVNAWGAGQDSSQKSAMPMARMTPPAVPQGVSATANGFSVGINWTTVPGAKAYHIRRSTASGGFKPFIGTAGANATEYIDVPPGANTYYYVVEAVNEGGPSAQSLEVSATTD